ncbi:MAG: sulfite exporter TauE/SafE family protein [Balneolaceae bacterium]
MELVYLIILLILGLVAGVVAGLFGVGGGVFFTPILFYIFSGQGVESPVVWTIGTSLFCTFTASFSSTLQQFRQKNFYLKEGVKVGLLGACGVYAGKWIATSPAYTDVLFVSFFSLILAVVAVLFYRRGSGVAPLPESGRPVHLGRAGVTGGLGGFVAALAGVGGGVVMVPMMNLGYRIGMKRAVSISSFAIVIISLSGWLQFALFSRSGPALTSVSLGSVDIGTALPLVLGSLAGGYFGVRINHSLQESRVQIAYSLLVLFIAILMIARVW